MVATTHLRGTYSPRVCASEERVPRVPVAINTPIIALMLKYLCIAFFNVLMPQHRPIGAGSHAQYGLDELDIHL
jgi:hypothetical protein